MRIKSIHVEKLFGNYNYDIDLDAKIRIIHGPNGCGKTTILKIIDAVFNINEKMDELKAIEFAYASFSLDNGVKLYIYRQELIIKGNLYPIKYLSYRIIGESDEVYDPIKKLSSDEKNAIYNWSTQRILKLFPYLEPRSEDMWYDARREIELTSEDVFNRYGNLILQRYSTNWDIVPDKVQEIISEIKVILISTDRLTIKKPDDRRFGDERFKVEQKVSDIAHSISLKINVAIQQYAQLSQSLDRSFPLRAIQNTKPFSIDEIKSKLIELEAKRKQFFENGLLNEESEIDIHELLQSITPNDVKMLSVYTMDTDQKFNALSEISQQISLFKALIERNFSHKQIVFDRDQGLYFKLSLSDRIIKPKDLSSGEQHELVMFYDLIFNTSKNTLVLIDEPEISLHIKWQLEYIQQLREIINISGFYALIATHSTEIVNDNWDITVSLSSEGL